MATATVYSKDGADAAISAALTDTLTTADKGAHNGVASLDGAGKVPTAQVPDLPYLTEGDLGDVLDATDLPALGVAITLTWDGTDYQPTALKSVTTRTKIFVGPNDPSSVSGVTLSPLDTWNRTS